MNTLVFSFEAKRLLVPFSIGGVEVRVANLEDLSQDVRPGETGELWLGYAQTPSSQWENDHHDWYFSRGLLLTLHGIHCEPVFWQDSSDMGVSKNRGTPKWMVYNGKPY